MNIRILPLALLCLLLAACGTDASARRTVYAMDTVMELTAYGGAEAALDAAEAELNRLDRLLARGDRQSAVYAYNHGADADAELSALIAEAEAVSAATDGAFDPYLGAVLDLWGFGSGAGAYRVPDGAALSAAPPLLDLGGIAKGLALERVRDILAARGVTGAVIDLGGDVALLGRKPDGAAWRVAVRDPDGGYLGVLETAGGAYVATSGVYERYFEENGVRYHHILDPRTRRPAESGTVSATVSCESGVWADALATACCVLGRDGALRLRERLADTMPFELILVDDGGAVTYTSPAFTPESGKGYTYVLQE